MIKGTWYKANKDIKQNKSKNKQTSTQKNVIHFHFQATFKPHSSHKKICHNKLYQALNVSCNAWDREVKVIKLIEAKHCTIVYTGTMKH